MSIACASVRKPETETDGCDCRDARLDQDERLTSPVRIVDVYQEGKLIERESRSDAERDAEAEFRAVRARDDSDRARRKSQRNPGNEVMHAHIVGARCLAETS